MDFSPVRFVKEEGTRRPARNEKIPTNMREDMGGEKGAARSRPFKGERFNGW